MEKLMKKILITYKLCILLKINKSFVIFYIYFCNYNKSNRQYCVCIINHLKHKIHLIWIIYDENLNIV